VLAFAAGSDCCFDAADADAAIEARFEALQSGADPRMARLEQSLEAARSVRHSPLRRCPGPGTKCDCACLSAISKVLESNATGTGQGTGDADLQAQGVAQLPAGPGLN